MIPSQIQTLIPVIPFLNQNIYLKKIPRGWLLYRWLLLGWPFFRWLLLTFSLNKTPLGETGCLENLYFLLTGCLSIQFFYSPPFSQHSQLGCLWLPTPGCAAPVRLTGCHATPLVTRCFWLQPLMSSLTLPWAISRFLDPSYSFSQAHCRVIRDFTPTPNYRSRGFAEG